MQTLEALGVLRRPQTPVHAKTPPMALRPTATPAISTLSLAQALRITKSTPPPAVPSPDLFLSAVRVPVVRAKRDADNAVVISEAQARGFLPPGRYRVQRGDGSVICTREIGESWCKEGLRLRQQKAAERRIAKERAIQDLLFEKSVDELH
jgi:hypothetical protein